MTRRIRRQKDFEVSLQIHSEDFIRPPRDSQRNWLLNRAIKEFADDLGALDERARTSIPGAVPALFPDRTLAPLEAQEIMEDWQIPVMRAMARAVTDTHGDVLEIGFGRGIASSFIQAEGVRSHTVVECNPRVMDDFHRWRERQPGERIRLVPGRWQDVGESLEVYDGIFFHTYPLNSQEYAELVVQSVTFAAHFFPTASERLRPGGRFSYLSNEADSLSRGHQRLLFQHFSSFSLSRVTDLAVPRDSHDAHWSDEMVIVQAVK